LEQIREDPALRKKKRSLRLGPGRSEESIVRENRNMGAGLFLDLLRKGVFYAQERDMRTGVFFQFLGERIIDPLSEYKKTNDVWTKNGHRDELEKCSVYLGNRG